MSTSVAELIADRIGAMPAGERRAAQTLIANYPLIGLKTVADFSQQAGVSSPTILRFVGRLGFQNYPGVPVGACRTNSPRNCSRRSIAHENPSFAAAGERVADRSRRSSTTSAKPSGTLGKADRAQSPRSLPTAAARPSWSAAASPIRSPATWPRI